MRISQYVYVIILHLLVEPTGIDHYRDKFYPKHETVTWDVSGQNSL